MHMNRLNFRKPETFKTPDGQEWIINPLKVKDMRYVAQFTKLHGEYTELRKAGKFDEANNLLYGNVDNEEDDPENEKSMVGFSNKMVDLAVKNIKTGDKFPEEYRLGEELLSLCAKIVEITTNPNPKAAKAVKELMSEDGPFPLKDSSDKPVPTSMPSKKSRKKRKKKS